MDETRLKTVIGETDLVIYFESNVFYAEHIASKVKKATSVAGLIRRSFTYLDKDMFRTLFTTIVRPHLEYGAPIWNPHSKRLVDLIENVQRRASKMIPGLSHLTYQQRLEALQLPTLQYRRYRGDMIEMVKLSHGHCHEAAIRDIIEFGSTGTSEPRLRRHKYHGKKERFREDLRSNVVSRNSGIAYQGQSPRPQL